MTAWKARLEEVLSTYFGDGGLEECVRWLWNECGWKPRQFRDELVSTLQQAIDAADSGDPEVAAILQRALGGDLEGPSQAATCLRAIHAGVTWKHDLEETLSCYFGDESWRDAIEALVQDTLRSESQPELLAALRSAITAAEAGDNDVALILQRARMGTLPSLPEAITFLRALEAAYLEGVAAASAETS